MLLIDEYQSLLRSRDNDGFVRFIEDAVRRDANGRRDMEPEDFSIKAMHEAWVRERNNVPSASGHTLKLTEAVDSTAFAKATGALINEKVIDGYDRPEAIGDRMVTIVPSSLKEETIVGMNALNMPEEVLEGNFYPDSSFAEKYVTVKNNKYGRILSITEETIMFDQTGQILTRAYTLGENARLYREKLIVEAVTEITSNIYKPSGSATTLYASGNSNLVTSNAFGTAGLKSAENNLMERTDENSNPIGVPKPWILLVPSELVHDAQIMFKSEKDPDKAEDAANIFGGEYQPLTSQYLTSATDWWLGNFARQFVWTQVYPLQVLSQAAGHDADFERDIRYRHKVRFYGGCGAVDYQYVVESNA